jgi:hypothetical protein
MKFLADENVARPIVRWLRQMGHDVLYAAEAAPGREDAVWVHEAGRLPPESESNLGLEY